MILQLFTSFVQPMSEYRSQFFSFFNSAPALSNVLIHSLSIGYIFVFSFGGLLIKSVPPPPTQHLIRYPDYWGEGFNKLGQQKKTKDINPQSKDIHKYSSCLQFSNYQLVQ